MNWNELKTLRIKKSTGLGKLSSNAVGDLPSMVSPSHTSFVEVPKKPVGQSKEIVTYKFMLTIDQYPNGAVYPRIFQIGKEKKVGKKKARKKVKMQESIIQKGEEY